MIRDTVLIPNGLNTWNEERYEMTGYINNINTANTQVLMEFHDKGYAGNIYEYAIGISNSYDKRESVSHWQNTNYYSYDGRGSVSDLVDGTGKVQMYHSYEPDGQTTLRFRSYIKNPYRYNAERVDYVPGIADFQYLRARYYAPNLGRFIQQDIVWGTIQTPLSQNLFIYVQNNAVNMIDPSGHRAMENGGGGSGGQVSSNSKRKYSFKDPLQEYLESNRNFAKELFQDDYKKLSNSKTSTKVYEHINIAIKYSYSIDCSGFDDMTLGEYFNKITGPQIFGSDSLFANSAKGDGYEAAKKFLNYLMANKIYTTWFGTQNHYISIENAAMDAFDLLGYEISDYYDAEFGSKVVNLAMTGLSAYASGGNKFEIIGEMIYDLLEPNEPGVSDLIMQELGVASDKLKDIGSANDYYNYVKNTEYQYLVTYSVGDDFIKDIELEQEKIMGNNVSGKYDNEFTAYQLYYLEQVKLTNLNYTQSYDKLREQKAYYNDMWRDKSDEELYQIYKVMDEFSKW